MSRMGQSSRFRAVCIPGLLVLVSALAVAGKPQSLDASSSLRDFASWPEATAEPYKVPRELWTNCMPPIPGGHPGQPVAGDADLSIRVYASPQAYPLMRSTRGAKFPAGSRIAKAKLVEGSSLPVAVAFMIKHEAGYDPAALDWEFLYFDGDPLHQVTLETGLGSCQGCHGALKEGDGVFGSYLPERQGKIKTE